jgi:hypothetical protein
VATYAHGLKPALQREARPNRLVADDQIPSRLLQEPSGQPCHRFRLLRHLPLLRLLQPRAKHRHLQRLLMRIDPDICGTSGHVAGSGKAAGRLEG